MIHAGVFFLSVTVASAGTIVRTTASESKISRLTPGSTVVLRSESGVYGCQGALLPQGSRFEITVDRVEKDRGAPWWRHAATFLGAPAPQPAARHVIVRSAKLETSGLPATPVDVAVREWFRQRPALRRGTKSPASPRASKDSVVVLEVLQPIPSPAAAPARATTPSAGVNVPSGAVANVMLLSPLSASNRKEGTPVLAQLTEPLVVDGQAALPAGVILEGRVTRATPPRRLRRAATLGLSFQRLQIGSGVDVAAALSGAETGQAATIDQEGAVTSKRPLARTLLDAGIGYVSGKVVDDVIEEGVKGIWGAAASGTAATAARYVALGVGVGFFIAQRGPDVRLPKYSKLSVTFTRPFTVAPEAARCTETGVPLH